MSKIKILILTLVAVLALSVAGVSVATAGKGKVVVKTSLKAKYTKGGSSDPYDPFESPGLKGHVTAPKKAGVAHRKVKAKSTSGKKIGADKTDKKGRWAIRGKLPKGTYKVRVKKRLVKGKTIVCKGTKARVKVP